LSVLRAMLEVKAPPWAKILYLADLARFPYGPRPAAEVRDLALSGVDVLAEHGSSFVAVACNTASASGVRPGEVETPVPILDIIGPGARYAVSAARAGGSRRVLVLGTEGTISSRVWEKALGESGWSGPVSGWACPFLANIIEDGLNGLVVRRAVVEATRGLVPQCPDAPGAPDLVVLGCTHYPFVARVFEEVLSGTVLGRPVRVIDPARALAEEILAGLRGAHGPAGAEGVGSSSGERARAPVEVRFFTTGRKEHFRKRASSLLADEAGRPGHRLRLDDVTEVSLARGPVRDPDRPRD